MDIRKQQLEEVARKIKEIEQDYRVIIISDNGYTDALIVDCQDGTGYHYISKTSTIKKYE